MQFPMRRRGPFDARAIGCRCDECPLGDVYKRQGSFAPVPPEGPDDAQYVLIGEEPGSQEMQYRRPFIGGAGQLLERTLNRLGVTREEVLLTTGILCRTPRNEPDIFNSTVVGDLNRAIAATNKALPRGAPKLPRVITPQEACRPHVNRIVDAAAARGAVVVALGKSAYWAVSGHRAAVKAIRGSFSELVATMDVKGKRVLAQPTEATQALFGGFPRIKLCTTVNPSFAMKEGNAPWREVIYRDLERAIRWHRGSLQWEDPLPRRLLTSHPPAKALADWLRRPGWYTWDVETAPAYPMEEGRKDLEDHVQSARENKLRVLGIYCMERREGVVIPWVSIDGRVGFAPGVPNAGAGWLTPPLGMGLSAAHGPTRTLRAPSRPDQTEAVRRHLDPWWAEFDDYHYNEPDGDLVWDSVCGWIADPRSPKVGHYSNYFDHQTVLRHVGPVPARNLIDQILLCRVWNSELPRSLYFIGTMLTDVPSWKASKDDRVIAQNPRSQEELAGYNLTDLYVTAQTAPILIRGAHETGKWPVVDLDHKVQAICREMHELGLWVHEETRAAVEQETREKLDHEQREVTRIAGADFNPRSTKQFGELLYETWGYPVPMLTASGKPSTSEDALRVLLTTPNLLDQDHRILLEAVWRSRGWQKDLSDVLLPMRRRSAGGIVHEDGVLRPDYTAHIPATGRISAGGPNTQNWRKRLRQIIRPRPGHVFLMADYDQIELRLMSAVAQVTAYLAAFARGDDPHAVTAALVYGAVFERELAIYKQTGVKTDRFTALRRFAKTFVYAVLYGGGASTVYDNVAKAVDDDGNLLFPNMGFSQVEAAVKAWMRNAHEVPAWWAKTWSLCEALGYVEEPILGRRRHMPEFLRNEAINHGIQGGAAIIMGLGLVRLREAIGPDLVEQVGIVNQMHDAVTVEVPESRALELAKVVTESLTMEFPDKLPNMRFTATADCAIDWSEKFWRAPGAPWDKVVAKVRKQALGLGEDPEGLAVQRALDELRADRLSDQFDLHKLEARLITAHKRLGG